MPYRWLLGFPLFGKPPIPNLQLLQRGQKMKESESLRLSKEVKNSFDVDEHFSCVSL